MRRRTTLLLIAMAAALALSTGAALAVTKQCRPDAAACNGTKEDDKLLGSSGVDDIFGLRGDDRLLGNEESDELSGGKGRDRLFGGPNNPVGFADRLDGGPGNDALSGGDGNDIYYYLANSWGKDVITEAAIPDTDPGTGNKINLQPSVTTPVTINLVSDSGPAPEMRNGDGTSTVNWSGNVVDRVESYSGGDDVIDGNPAANDIRSQNGVSVVSSGGGNDVVNVFDSAPGDTVDCGGVVVADNDTVYADPGDTVTRCENRLP